MKTTIKTIMIALVIVAVVVVYIFLGMTGVALKNLGDVWETEKLQLGDNYFIDYDSFSDLAIINEAYVVDGQILSWNFDSTFIIAKQKPRDSIKNIIYKEHPNIKFDKYQKLHNESKIYNYWIIDKREELLWDTINRRHTGSVKGPFTYEEYLEKRRELSVPDSLKLRETEKGSFDGLFDALFYEWFYSPTARERIVE